METVLVTGASGSVGHYVVALAEAAGLRVVVNDLSPRGLTVPTRGEIRVGDLRDPEVCRRVVEGCQYVVHTAALTDARAASAELARSNTDVVASLYAAATEAGVKRFVHVSSALLYAVGSEQPLTEESPIAPRGTYGLSKHAAEVFLRGQGPGTGPAWTIMRAAPLYGRRGRHFAATLLAVAPIMRLALPILPRPHGGPRATLVHSEDVARALLFVMRRDACEYQAYNVSDGDAMTLAERVTGSFHAYGLRTLPSGPFKPEVLDWAGRFFQAPGAYATMDAALVSAWKLVTMRHRLKPALRPRIDRETYTLLYDDLVVDASKLRALGWKPRFERFEEGWREVLRWYQAEGWVPRYA